MARILGWTSPHPELGSPIELGGGDTHVLLDLFGIGETLVGERVATEEALPAFL